MRCEAVRGKWTAALAAFLWLACACTPPNQTNTNNVATVTSPSPSTSPTPIVPVSLTASAPFHGGEVGVAYATVALTATGGAAPYAWSVSSGALPGGLAVGSDGSVSGTPTSAGTFTFTIRVADSASSSANLPGVISIVPALSASLIPSCATYCYVELGCVNVCGSFGQQSGGAAPYSYTLDGGSLPSGTALGGLALTGTFTGQPGWLQFTVRITDGFGATAILSPRFWMLAHIAVASGVCSGNYNSGCVVKLPYSGGRDGVTPSVRLASVGANPNQGCWDPSSTSPPGGSTLTAGGGYVTVVIPNRLINGYGAVWTIVISDQNLCSAGANCVSGPATVTIGVQCG